MLGQSKPQLVQGQRGSFHRKTTMLSPIESHSFFSDLAMVFDVAVESEDTNYGFNGARSSTCDEGASQHRCEADAEITCSEADHVVVKIRSRCGVLFDGEGKDKACK